MSEIPGANYRILGSALASAPPEKFARIVSLVDALPHDAPAKRLLDRARPRLREMNLPRPLQLTRVLFLPVEGLIREPGRWRPGEKGGLPRTALMPLWETVASRLGPAGEILSRQCDGRFMSDESAVMRVGGALWPAAARCLPDEPPHDWEGRGLPARAYAEIASLCAVAWRHGPAIWPAVQGGTNGPTEELAQAAMRGPAGEGSFALEVACMCLMARATRPAMVARVALDLASKGDDASSTRIRRLLDEHVSGVALPEALFKSNPDPGETADGARTALTLIEDLERSSLASRPLHQDRIRQLRHEADVACRRCFKAVLDERLLAATKDLQGEGEPQSIEELEEHAVAITRLAGSGRKLGDARIYDRSLRSAAERMVGQVGASKGISLQRAEALRLAEILVGPDTALEIVR